MLCPRYLEHRAVAALDNRYNVAGRNVEFRGYRVGRVQEQPFGRRRARRMDEQDAFLRARVCRSVLCGVLVLDDHHLLRIEVRGCLRCRAAEAGCSEPFFMPLFTEVRGRFIIGNGYAASCKKSPRRFGNVSILAPRESGADHNI